MIQRIPWHSLSVFCFALCLPALALVFLLFSPSAFAACLGNMARRRLFVSDCSIWLSSVRLRVSSTFPVYSVQHTLLSVAGLGRKQKRGEESEQGAREPLQILTFRCFDLSPSTACLSSSTVLLSMAPKSKKARTTGPTPLGAFLPSAASFQKDESELELEEAVFGRGRVGKGSVWDLEPEDQVVEEYEEVPETGLERLSRTSTFGIH